MFDYAINDNFQDLRSQEELALLRLCEAAVTNGIAIADNKAPDFTSETPEDIAAVRSYTRELTRGISIPSPVADDSDALLILSGELIACTNAAMSQRIRDRAWMRADNQPPWYDRFVRRGWETLLMRLADAGFRVNGIVQAGLVARAEAPECYRMSEDEFRTGWISGQHRPYQWCARRDSESVNIARREFGSRKFETILNLPLHAVDRLVAFLNAVA